MPSLDSEFHRHLFLLALRKTFFKGEDVRHADARLCFAGRGRLFPPAVKTGGEVESRRLTLWQPGVHSKQGIATPGLRCFFLPGRRLVVFRPVARVRPAQNVLKFSQFERAFFILRRLEEVQRCGRVRFLGKAW